jgi:hypothetical protein
MARFRYEAMQRPAVASSSMGRASHLAPDAEALVLGSDFAATGSSS